MNARTLTAPQAPMPVSEQIERTRAVVEQHKGFSARWRERARERLSREPAHTNVGALYFSLEAIDEALNEDREFSWACSERERIAVLDRCVIKAAGGLV